MIRVGIGGWNFAPWKGTFYPKGLPATQELAYAAEHLTTIEINATFYRTQSPASFKKWAASTPEHFQFSVKAHQAAVNKKDLREAGEAIGWFTNSGIAELGDRLGPLFWQLAPHKKFNAEEIAGFFALLPEKLGKQSLRHAIEVRGPTFQTPEFYALAKKHNVAIIFVDSEKHAMIDEPTADFTYARLQRAEADEPNGYTAAALKKYAKQAQGWGDGGKRDAYLYFISAAKERNPAAAQALIKLVK